MVSKPSSKKKRENGEGGTKRKREMMAMVVNDSKNISIPMAQIYRSEHICVRNKWTFWLISCAYQIAFTVAIYCLCISHMVDMQIDSSLGQILSASTYPYTQNKRPKNPFGCEVFIHALHNHTIVTITFSHGQEMKRQQQAMHSNSKQTKVSMWFQMRAY